MSSQADVRSIDALKDFRVALALYEEDTLAALGAVEAEVRRTSQWLLQDRPLYWQEQIKRRREQVTAAKSEVFRRQLQKKPDYSPSMSEPMEILRRAEASLQDAEKRLSMVRKWQPLFQQAVLEYHGSIQRIKELAAVDVPRAVNLLSRLIDALEAYLQVVPPSGLGTEAATGSRAARALTTSAEFEKIAASTLDGEDAAVDPAAPREPSTQDAARESAATGPDDYPPR
jgi:hypothetical protein